MTTTQEDKQELLVENFQEWLRHPITRRYLCVLEKLRDDTIKLSVNSVTDTKLDNAQFRLWAAQVKNIDAMLKVATDFTSFSANTKQQ